MAELPRGTVTFVFTDIEGSTSLVKRLRDRYGEVLEQHQRILRGAFEGHEGREIDTQGDSFFFAFARARDAVAAAVDAQRALAGHDWPEDGEVRVRMGLHTGEPSVGEQRYVGFGVNRAARISAAGHGGQVLLSNATRELVEDDLPGGVGVRELGTYRLKDVDRPERLFQLEIEGLASVLPPLRATKVAEPHPLRRRAILLGALAGVLAAAVAIPLFALGQGGGGSESPDAASGNSVALLDPKAGRLVADVAAGTTPTAVALGAGAAWVTNTGDGTVDRIDLATATVRQTIRVGNGPTGVAFGSGSVWVANGGSGTVSRIDPLSNEVTEEIAVGNGPGGIDAGGGKVWVVNRDDATLSRIDPNTGKVDRTTRAGAGPVEVAVGAGGVWVTSQADGKVLRVDPSTAGVLETVSVGRGPAAITAAPSGVWVANSLDGTVSRIDPETSSVTATIEVGEGPSGIAAGTDAVWVGNQFDGSLSRIDTATNQVTRSISIGGNPTGVAAGSEGVLAAVRPASGEHRGGTLTVLEFGGAKFFYKTLDPGVDVNLRMSMLYDGLTAFRRVGGREGTQVVPDLATSLPEASDAGKTYTFRLRRGIRYSNGKPLRASDVRHTLERTFALEGFGNVFFESLVGGKQCLRKPGRCDLSQGIVADDATSTVTFRLTRPDPEFLIKLALNPAWVVPGDTPRRDLGRRPPPGTGPYQVSSASDRQVRLVRNPHFREWSRAARPAGKPDEIVIRIGVATSDKVQAVARGEADLADISNSGLSTGARLRARFGSRLHSSPGPFVVYTLLNTRLAPFDDVRVRKALNLAVDREAVALAAGPENAAPTCQVLPQNYPGYRPYCPYKRDLATARRLVAASGTRGAKVVVWTRRSYKHFYRHIVAALRALGYRARLQVVDDVGYYDVLEKRGLSRVQASYAGWATDYASGLGYLEGFLGYLKLPPAQFSDKAVDRELQRGIRLQQTDPTAANDVWARIDRMVVDRAPLVPMFDARALHLLSARAGNYQYHPQWDVLLDQIWVR